MNNIRTKLLGFLKVNWDVILLAFVIGSLVIAPSLYFRYASGSFKGVDLFHGDAEWNYLAQIQEVDDGHPALGNIYTQDGKDAPHALQQPFAAMTMAYSGRVFGLTAPQVNLVAKFVMPFLLTFIVFFLLLFLTEERWMALLGTGFIMFAPATGGLFVPSSWWPMIVHGIFPDADYQFLHYSRSINPQFSTFFFYGYFLALWKFLFKPKNEKLEGVITAILLGLAFYTYFFVYSFVAVFTALLFFWFLFKKDFVKAKRVVAISLGGILIGIPTFLNTLQAMHMPNYVLATQRVGAFLGHGFIFSRVWWGAFIIFLLLWKKIKNEKMRIFVFLFLVTGFILTNQQVITGHMIPAPQHYHWYYLSPFIGALFMMLLAFLAKKYLKPKTSLALCVGALLLMVWLGAFFQKRSYDQYLPMVTDEQRYADVLTWLNTNTPKDAAVLGNPLFSSLVVGVTHDNAYYHHGLTDFMVPTERLRDGYFVYAYLDGLTKPEDVQASFDANRYIIGSWLYGEYYRQMTGDRGGYSDAIQQKLVTDYKAFLSKDFMTDLKQYPINYIVWDKQKDPTWDVERFAKDEVYEKDGVAVYKI